MKNNTTQNAIKINKKPSQPGKWVYKPTRSTVLVCSCGNKYIATREGQTVCVSCIRALSQKQNGVRLGTS